MAQLAGMQLWVIPPYAWFTLHILLVSISALCTYKILPGVGNGFEQPLAIFGLVWLLGLLIPFAGVIGSAMAIHYGYTQSKLRQRDPDYWQSTPRVELPFTTPAGRQAVNVDSRGFVEHLMYSSDDEDLYRKVLAAGNIRSSLSVTALKQAMRHQDERIRLTAYKTLDRKITELNRQIQQLETRVAEGDNVESSNSWLQIASNYWELLTLEKGEPVARQQLLDKASAAAIQAVAVLPINRNAHFILGRVSLLQGDTRRALVAFDRAHALGMPADKVLPYLAETEFQRHNFVRVRSLLNKLGPAAKAYPPLSHVAEYWA